MLPLAALVLIRGGEQWFMPTEDTPLARDDQVLLVGKPAGLSQVREVCHYPATVEYLATEANVIDKSGAWLSYRGERIGQGRENAKEFLRTHPEIAAVIEAGVLAKHGVNRLGPEQQAAAAAAPSGDAAPAAAPRGKRGPAAEARP